MSDDEYSLPNSLPNGHRHGIKPGVHISDMIRLATAGVQFAPLDVEPIIDPILYNHPPPDAPLPRTLVDLFWDRYSRAQGARARFDCYLPPFQLYAHEYGEIVYVMFCPASDVPVIIEDAAACFPSDALMAKVALYKGTTA